MNLEFTDGRQFKAKIINFAKVKQLDSQIVMQEVALEELILRISKSKYRGNVILKGGFLISSIFGINTRSTRDLDTSIKKLDVTEIDVSKMFSDIVNMNVLESNVIMKLIGIQELKNSSEYERYRVHIEIKLFSSLVDAKVDVSTGDVITPGEISWIHKTLFNDQQIEILAYNMETIIAEKIETILSRKEFSTRMKDYLDLYLFDKFQIDEIDWLTLRMALNETTKHRKSESVVEDYQLSIAKLRKSPTLNDRWQNYQKSVDYAKNIKFGSTCDALLNILSKISE